LRTSIGDRAAERLAGAHAAEELDVVALDLHAPPTPVAHLPPGELRVHVLGPQGHARGHPLDDGDERRAVRLAGGGEAEEGHAQGTTAARGRVRDGRGRRGG
jgi:hypothetical protein